MIITDETMSAALEHPRQNAVRAKEYLRMGEAGVFAQDARLELIDGEIVEMAPISPPHASVVALLNHLFVPQVGDRGIVWVKLWVVDVNAREVHVHREPSEHGYASVSVATGEDIVQCIALAEICTSPKRIFRGF
jgi:Uma2 family endonuclease